MIGLGAGFGAFNIILSHLIGPHKPTPEKLAPYECGMPPVGDARERHPVKFYLVAMIFLLFDIGSRSCTRSRCHSSPSDGLDSSRSLCFS
jgi:NADH:ubiquinone oxidoreductase subunit 3 (subunit A)